MDASNFFTVTDNVKYCFSVLQIFMLLMIPLFIACGNVVL